MKTFETFQELFDYVPNCIICGKQLEFHLNGRVKSVLSTNYFYTSEPLHFHLKIKDKALVGKNKKHSVVINLNDNNIVFGHDTISQLMADWITITKKCYTCRCNIIAKYTSGILRNPEKFPPLILTNEELYYTRKGEKSVNIQQVHYDDTAMLGVRTWIAINNKPVNPLYIDFNKFKNLKHLNERLSTILVFS